MRDSLKWFRSMCRGILFLLLFVLCCGGCAGVVYGMEECAEKKEGNGAGQLRCIAFYSSVNGVSSTIFRVTSSIQEHLGTDERILLSVYCLPSDLYESLDYKVKTAAALDMDVMIVSNMSGDLDEDNLEELQENQIFVLAVDGQPSAYELSACIGADNRSAGRQAARLVAGIEGEHCAGILATSFRGGNISVSRQERQAGFEEEAKGWDCIEIIPRFICTANTLEAMRSVREYLEENPQMDVLYCLDSASGVIASKVLAEQGRTDEVYVICFDQTEQVQREMKEGGIDAVIEQEAEKIGRECVDFLLRIAACDDIQEMGQEERAVPCRIITRE